ncbi:MAG: fructose-bisphosphatase class II, partial [Candidatus Acidiferrales bacterium]
MQRDLSLDFLRVVEEAAIAAARTMGLGDRHSADKAATGAMRKELATVPIKGRIVIGEGERDEAPMLFIGEEVGAPPKDGDNFPEIDIAVDPLEGTNLCAAGKPNAITVMAASERGGLLHAPDIYMQKLAVGPTCKGAVDLEAPVKDNLRAIAQRLDREVEDLVIVVLDRPRHEQLIKDIRVA